jgi:hypothetical protein
LVPCDGERGKTGERTNWGGPGGNAIVKPLTPT